MNTPSTLPGVISLPGDATVLRAYGDEIIVHLSGNQTGGKFTMFTDITPAGGGPPPHYHLNEDEWFHVLEGQVSYLSGGKWQEAGPGGTAFMPRGIEHTFKNVGDKPLRQLITLSPAGFETFFSRSAEEFRKPGGPDMQRIIQIGIEHGIHFVQL